MKKEIREKVYNKFGGRCAYCGEELKKGWHVDELKPVRRNSRYDKTKKRWVYDGTCENPENFNFDNQMPSCPSCNINKHSMSLEDFRNLIKGFMKHLNERNTQYKIAKRYGLVAERPSEVTFYFEKVSDKYL